MTKRHCNNCNSQKESWVDHPSYNSSEIFAREERCWSCNRWTLSREMIRIDNVSSIFLAAFVPPSLPFLGMNYASRLLNGKDLENYIQMRTGISNAILDVVPFETWWNKNVGTVINGSYSHTLWLVVYEPSQNDGKIREIIKKFEISNGYDRYNLDSVKNKGLSLRIELDRENPILYIHPSVNNYTSFSNIIREPYMIKIETLCDKKMYYENGIDYYSGRGVMINVPTNEPEKYLKPLDVVWVEKTISDKKIYHVGVYLGNDKVSHYSGEDKKQYESRIKITNWNKFIEGYSFNGDIFAYHPVIPFKNYKQIAQQIDWADNNSYWEGKYCLANNNCEHRANSFVCGINYSKQVQERPGEAVDKCSFWRECGGGCKNGISNSSKGSTIKLTDEIMRTNSQLNKSSGYWYDKVKDEYEARVVVPVKDCQIM